jgi:peptidyl-prolyl cis-trans isomerase C
MLPVQEVRKLLLDRAGRLGIEGDTEELRIDALLDREVALQPPTEPDCRDYYAAHPERFRSGDLVEADHILFAVTDNVPLPALRQRAQQALGQVLADPACFASLARELSNCPSAEVGGNLGQLSRGDVVPEFWQAITAFEGIGVVPKLVETRYGLHLLRIARRVDGRALPFEAVCEEIAARLAEKALQQALRNYAHGLLHEAEGEPN